MSECDAITQQVYEMSCEISFLFKQKDKVSRTKVDLLAPCYAQKVFVLGQQCPEIGKELQLDYEKRFKTHNVTPKIFVNGSTLKLSERDTKIVREVVHSNLQYDQQVLQSKMGWGQWFSIALSQRPRW